MKFKYPSEEIIFNRMLVCYMEEFGPELITVIVPKAWLSSVDIKNYQPMAIQTWDDGYIGIRVEGSTANYTQEC